MKNRVKLKGRLNFFLKTNMYMGLLLAVVNLGVYLIDYRAGLLLSCFVLFYLVMSLIMTLYNKPVITNELVSFATEYGQIQRKLLRDLELPHAILDDSGRVIWTNRAFETVTHKDKGYRKSVFTLFPGITKDKLPGEDTDETSMKLEFEDSIYEVKFRKILMTAMAENSDIIDSSGYDGYLIAMYLFDNTALEIALKENDDQSLAVGMIYLDNYEEALESVEEVRRSLLIALIDRKINKYVAALDGIVKKTEKDKYLLILRKMSVAQLQECRFDLLEDVKKVNIGNEMAVTISIGVGYDGLSYSQNYEFARTAIDLALGRGGDQAVVKTPEHLIYYGGKSQQMEKNTRVKARVKAHALREILNTKDRVLIMGHRLADVDSFGAAVGIYRIARTLDKKAQIVLNDVSPTMRPWVDLFIDNPEYEHDMFLNSQQAAEVAGSNTVLIVVDVNKPSITECPELLRMCKSIVVFDHHRQGGETIDNATLSYVEAYASSTCEMVSEILQYVDDNVRIRGEEADCMYAGMVVDTSNFNTKTGVRTFEAAAYLRRNGADIVRVRKMFREDAAAYLAKADAVRQAEIYRGDYAISVCTGEEEDLTVIGAQAANELLNIKGIKASFVLTLYQDTIYVSARSIDEVNVQIIMERMGGGGHMNVAGCQMSNTSIEDVKVILKRTLDTMIEEGAI